MDRYIGITLGPVDRVIDYAKSVAGIWGASYFFSTIGKMISDKLKLSDRAKKDLPDKRNVLKPLFIEDMHSIDLIGRYPDQYIFKARDENETIDSVRKCCDEVIDVIASNMSIALYGNPNKSNEINQYLQKTLRIYIVENEINLENKTEDKSIDSFIVDEVQDSLNAMELWDSYSPELSVNYLADLFKKEGGVKREKKETQFDALRRFYDGILNFEKDDKDKERLLSQIDSKFKVLQDLNPKKPYVAFVSADGDNYGKHIATISQFIPAFNKKFKDYVEDVYGGQVIFIGGDDITFYAPVISPKDPKKHIFNLIEEIDEIAKNELVVNSGLSSLPIDKQPHFSYGIAISYHKFPMAETRKKAVDLLFFNAKKITEKNSICWCVRKHSGQTFNGTIKKSHEISKQQIFKLFNTTIGDKDFLHSLTHGLERWSEPLKYILDNYVLKINDENRDELLIDNFFHNTYNKEEHKGDERRNYLKIVCDLLICFRESGLTSKESIKKVQNLLKYVELLNRDEDDK